MQCVRDNYTEILQQELNEIKEPEELYYHIEIQEDAKREVNPFKLRSFLSVTERLKN